jgi:mono/diheme cytochrome c family protein
MSESRKASKPVSGLPTPLRMIITFVRQRWALAVLVAAGAGWVAGCGGGGDGSGGSADGSSASAGATSAAGELTQEQMENGIGPITKVELGAIDPARVTRGEEIFALKCAACHKLDERYIGPALRDVTERRTPEFILNMMLNSWEMTQMHPTVKEMLATYYTPMPDQGLTEEDARALLDYLRQAKADGPGGN